MTQQEYTKAAADGVAYVKKVVRFGSGNNPGDVIVKRLLIGNVVWPYFMSTMRDWEDRELAKRRTNFPALTARAPRQALGILADAADNFGVGNCGEQSALAFTYLEKRNIRPIEWMEFTDESHAFVILGRRAGTNLANFAEWSYGAALCDPWRPGSGIAGMLALWYRKYNRVRSIYRLD